MTCRCKTQFCYRCGSLWVNSTCGSNPPCALYSEEELLRLDMEVRGAVMEEPAQGVEEGGEHLLFDDPIARQEV